MVSTLTGIEQVQSLEHRWCAPFRVPIPGTALQANGPRTDRSGLNSSGFAHEHLILDPVFDLTEILFSTAWIDFDLAAMCAAHSRGAGLPDGAAFDQKYGLMASKADARSIIPNWYAELDRALSHLSPSALYGDVMHIGSDALFEPQSLHPLAKSVVLVDIAEQLLQRAASVSPKAVAVTTSAQQLEGFAQHSIDTIIGLRVVSSFGFDLCAAIQRFAQVLRTSGSLLLSVSNGYRGIDDTIVPGQIAASPAILDLSLPFRQAALALELLHLQGFCELFLTVGSAELFIGGTYIPARHMQPFAPVLHCDSPAHIPLFFHSPIMPTSWLGNYSGYPIEVDGYRWNTAEHYFQANKFPGGPLSGQVSRCASPDEAKRLAWKHQSEVRSDWNDCRESIMRKALHAKFNQYSELRAALVSTHPRELVERSPADHYWGRSVDGKGMNKLGFLLTQLRNEFTRYKSP